MKRLVVEFLGTFFLTLAVALTGSAIAIAAILMAWIYIGGHISGGHYNPAVSFGAALTRKMSWQMFSRYAIAQSLGALAAYFVATFLQGSTAIPAPAMGVSFTQAFIIEVLLAFVFVMVVLAVTSTKFHIGHVSGFAIGFTIPALIAMGGLLSGALFNPAIALGSHVYAFFAGMPFAGANLVMYILAALVGAALAVRLFDYLVNERDTIRI
jgi:aquaporin Z